MSQGHTVTVTQSDAHVEVRVDGELVAASGGLAIRFVTNTTVLRSAFAAASKPLPLGEPLDWMTTPVPREWQLNGSRVTYDWS